MALRRFALPFATALLLHASSMLHSQQVSPVSGQTPASEMLHLIPTPRELHGGRSQPIPQGVRITCASCSADAADSFSAQDLSESLAARGISTAGPFAIHLVRGPAASLPAEAQAEGYSIMPGANSLTVSAPSASGLFYAAQTLKQLIENDGARAVLHLSQIRDWPAMKDRGFHDDLSRGPVPTLAFQMRLIRELATYKYNLYSPYFEHTQQYASNPLFAPPGGSISATDARALVAFAAQYHITVVPEQEAFGHLHHNLTWEKYSALAETPHGAVLAPGQAGSLELIDAMFTELAALYPGPFLHVGADETSDLGMGQTKAPVDERGLGPVYLDFLQKIVASLAPLHRRFLFWGDIAQSIVQGATAYNSVGAEAPARVDPDLLKKLPDSFKQSTVAVAWWYTPHPAKGFARFITPFTEAGFETWVAPGLNNWSVVYPDNNDALTNIQQFVAEGQRLHATGMLNTSWNDDGESLADNNWYGILFGASAGWQSGEAPIASFEQSFGPVFHGDGTGDLNQAQLEMMACHDLLRNSAKVGDGSDGLFWIDPWSPDGQKTAAKLRPYASDLRLHAERALTLIANARAAYPAAAAQGSLPSRGVAEESRRALSYDPANAFPSNPTTLRHPEAIDALELGARRLDFIGLKFQLADEVTDAYHRALIAQASTDKKLHGTVGHELGDIRSINGRLEDIRDTYSLLRDLYQQTWMRANRPYALRPVLEHYDATIALWQARIDRFRAAQRQYADSKTLPAASEMGLPR